MRWGVLLVAACGLDMPADPMGPSMGRTNAPTHGIGNVASGRSRALVRLDPIAAGATCPTAGVTLAIGIDDDGNHVLAPREALATASACTSRTPVVTIAPGPVTAACPYGGQTIELDGGGVIGATSLCARAMHPLELRVDRAPCDGGLALAAGFDLDDDGVLADVEVDSTASLCLDVP